MEGLLLAVSHLYESSCCCRCPKGASFSHQPVVDGVKLLSNLAAQETPPREINDLTMDQIVAYMKVQFDPIRFVIRERFKFWTAMQRRPGESIQELAARIRQAAATCDLLPLQIPWTKHYVRALFAR